MKVRKFFVLLITFTQAAAATEPVYYEKVLATPTGDMRAVQRMIGHGENQNFQEWRLTRGNTEIARYTTVGGVERAVRYSMPLTSADAVPVGNYLDGKSVQLRPNGNPFEISATLPWVGNRQHAIQSMNRQLESMQKNADLARQWAAIRTAERRADLENRRQVIESLQQGVARMEADSVGRLTQNLASVFSSATGNDLTTSVTEASDWRAFYAAKPELQSIIMNQTANLEANQTVAEAAQRGEWEKAAALASDIASPLNASVDKILPAGFKSGTADAQQIFNKDLFPVRNDKHLEDQRIRMMNTLYGRVNERPDFYAGPGRSVGRAALIYEQASYDQERAGNMALARQYSAEALRLARGEAFPAERLLSGDETHLANAYRAYVGEPKSNVKPNTGEMVQLTVRASEKLMFESGKGETSEYKAGKAFAGLALKAIEEGDNESAEFYKNMTMAALDVAIGFIPPVSMVRDGYELITGYNMLTGQPLSSSERWMAAIGVATGGAGTFLLKTSMKTIARIATKSGVAAVQAARIGDITYDVQRVGFKSMRSVEALRRKIGYGEKQFEILNDVTKTMAQREHALPFKYVTREAESTFYLNADMSVKGFQPSFRGGDFALSGLIENPPQGLVRVFSEGKNRVNGSHLVHETVIAGKTPTQIKEALNLPNLPTHVADFAPAVTKDKKLFIRSSPIGKNDFGGVNGVEGYLQFEILQKREIPTEWFTNVRPL